MKAPTREGFLETLKDWPALTAHGLKSRQACERLNIDYDGCRRALENEYDSFVACCEWLSSCPLTKHVSPKSPHSYFIRDKLGDSMDRRYLSNGAFIAAVLYLGVPYKWDYADSNIQVAISRHCELLYGRSDRPRR